MANPGPSPLRRIGVLGATGTLATGSVAALLTALAVTPAGAATTFTVDDSSSGPANASDCTTPVANSCSLDDAVAAAADGDTIVFAPGITSITLTQGSLNPNAISILGPGSGVLTITTTDVAGAYDIFTVGGTGNATISGMKLTKNRIYADNDGDFTLDDVIVEDSEGSYGGALYTTNTGDAFITNSHFNRNHATTHAGAVYIYNDGDATISDSTFADNTADSSAGAIKVTSTLQGDFLLQRSSLTGNSAASYAGGLYTDNGGDVTIADTVIADNTAVAYSGGGAYISHSGYLTIERTSVLRNTAYTFGGGLYISSSVTGSTILSSTIAGNTAFLYSGGGISLDGSNPITIANSTITGNSAGDKGGALYLVDNPLYVLQSTITQNTATVAGGGLYIEGTTTVVLTGSILAGNTSGGVQAGGFDNVSGNGDTIDSTNSILGDLGTPGSFTVNDLGGTIRTDDPGVEALAFNGGPTPTMALMPTSKAIDAGPTTVPTFPGNEYDQRGPGYARVVYGRVDIGAYEIQEPTPEPDPIIPAFTG